MLSFRRQDTYSFAMSHYKEVTTKYLKRKEQSFSCPMVNFTDAECGEFDFDGGGYRREFYSEFFHRCACDKDLFIGRPRRLVPNFNNERIHDFVAVGIAIVESILNGDCGFPYLHPAVFQVLIGNHDYHTYITVEDIPDPSIAHLVQEVNMLNRLYIFFVFERISAGVLNKLLARGTQSLSSPELASTIYGIRFLHLKSRHMTILKQHE